MKTVADRFWDKVDSSGGLDACWPWLGASETVSKRGLFSYQGRMQSAPRVAWELDKGLAFPSELDACHTCDNPNCVNPRHIWPGTESQNIRDCVAKDRHYTPRGVVHPAHKLDDERVRELRRRHAGGESYASLARAFGIAAPTARRIATRRSWKHVTDS